MNTNRLSKAITGLLNTQITNEAFAAQIYLSYAAWAGNKGFGGIANFLFRHAEEERNHMMKILEYILKRGAEVQIAAIPAPHDNPENIIRCFEKIFEHEVENTKAIYKIVKMSHVDEDWATWNFMQWFVKEQVEEETFASSLMDKIRIAGGEKATNNVLYTIDNELGKTHDEIRSAVDVTAANP